VPPSKRVDKRKPKRARKVASKSARPEFASASKEGRAAGKGVGKLFEDLVAVLARLRAPGGCPWDREQTHLTLRTYLIEEAYEVLDAIEKGSAPELEEELGDLLLQILFHADMAREAGTFDISDIITGIRDKLVRRHPHVFGTVKADTAAQVLKNWAQLKAKEKQSSIQGADSPPAVPSTLDGIPRNLPALLEAYQMTRRAAQVGFDWDSIEGILEKLGEEIGELKAALKLSGLRAAEDEVGDILFSVVNIARFLGFDPEVTLKHSNLKFKQRFRDMEMQASLAGRTLTQLSKEELEDLWKAAKAKAKSEVSSRSES
jgi:MazG family protein